MSDLGSHFINRIVSTLIEEIHIHHKKSTSYHPQVNGTVEAFNKVLEHVLTKVCVATFHTPGGECCINIQATLCVLGGKSQVKAVTLFLTPPFMLNS